MQNKKSVLFIEPESMISQAKAIKKELVKTTEFAGIVIPEKKLRCLAKNAFFDKIAPEGSSLRRTYKKIRKKMILRRPEHLTYGDACGLPQKTVRNLLYRFVPDIVVVSTEEALRSIIVEKKRLGIKCSVCVLCREKFDEEILHDEAEVYFVDNLNERNRLAAMNVDVDKIVIGTAPGISEREEEEKRARAKRNFGLDKEKAVLYCIENCEDALAEAIRAMLKKDTEVGYDRLFMCGSDSVMAESVSECGGRVVGDRISEELVDAVDLIVVRPENEIAEELKKYQKPVVDLTEEALDPENIDSLLSEKKEVSLSAPKRVFAEQLKKMLEEKLSAEPIEPEEEPEKWIPQDDEDDDDE